MVTDFGILVEFLQGRATFRLRDSIGRQLFHPDLQRIGLVIRILLVESPTEHRLRMEMEGGSCKAIIANAGKEYSSDRLGYRVIRGIGMYDFRFEEPLQPDATLTLEYGMGVQALEITEAPDSE